MPAYPAQTHGGVHFVFGARCDIRERKNDATEERVAMRRTNEQMKQALMKKLEAEIDALVEWCEATERPNLDQIEERVLAFRGVVSQEAARVLVECQEASYPASVRCARCGSAARNKGLKSVQVESQVGGLEIERSYWRCPNCGEGLFPPG